MKLFTHFCIAAILSVLVQTAYANTISAADTVEPGTAQSVVSTVNINLADADALSDLPGIGKGKAQAIIQYREQYGDFLHIEDIKAVKGIGEKLYAKLSSRLTVN